MLTIMFGSPFHVSVRTLIGHCRSVWTLANGSLTYNHVYVKRSLRSTGA